MKINAKWLAGTVARVALLGPLLGVTYCCECAIRFLDRRLPGG